MFHSRSAVRFGRESADNLITAHHLYLTFLDFFAGHDCVRSCCNWSAGYVAALQTKHHKKDKQSKTKNKPTKFVISDGI